MEHFTQRKNLGFLVDDGQHVNPKCGLHSRMLVQVIEHHIRIYISAQLDNNTHSVTIRLISEICYSFNPLLTNELGNFLNQPCLVNLVRNLMHNNSCFVVVLLNGCISTHSY
ncbi:hypothetical protein D3C87_1762650 [compost metagenome]